MPFFFEAVECPPKVRHFIRTQFAANGGLQMRRKRSYTEEFRRLCVARMQGCQNISALARELDVPRRLLYRWQMRLEGPIAPIVARSSGLEEENRLLKQLLAERTLEVDFFKGALQKIAARRQQNDGAGETASTTKCGQ
jgi:transposase-like protein